MAIRSVEYLQSLVRELAKLPDETEWVEFKCNNKQPQMIGEYISALSNSAIICGCLLLHLNSTHSVSSGNFTSSRTRLCRYSTDRIAMVSPL